MTNRMLDNRVAKLRALEAQIDELNKAADAIKADLKGELDAQNVEELDTGKFIIRWTRVISDRFDSKAFRKQFGDDVYKGLCRPVESRRFSIAG